ncbi:hypothetical protein FALCPG4_017805 [Fusarium falciforme]
MTLGLVEEAYVLQYWTEMNRLGGGGGACTPPMDTRMNGGADWIRGFPTLPRSSPLIDLVLDVGREGLMFPYEVSRQQSSSAATLARPEPAAQDPRAEARPAIVT